MTTNRPLRVFLCHSSNDKPAVRELYQKLRAEAWIEPWLDEEELYPGHDWDLEIEKAVDVTDVVIVVLSEKAINKEGYVQAELRYALDIARTKPEETIFIIPFKLEECKVPRRLTIYQYVDYFPESQHERVFKRLIVSLKRCAESLGLKYESVGQISTTTSKVETERGQDENTKNINIVINGDFINSNLNTGNSNQLSVSKEKSSTSANTLTSKENHVENIADSEIKRDGGRESYENLLKQVNHDLKSLSKIVVYCMFNYLLSGDTDTFLNNQLSEANRAVEDNFLYKSDDLESTFFLNLDDPAISRAEKSLRKLERYLSDTLSDDLYEVLKSEYGFEPSLKNKRYWENYLYGKL